MVTRFDQVSGRPDSDSTEGPFNGAVTVGAASVIVRPVNGHRRKLILVNQAVDDVWFAKGPLCTINEGIYCAAGAPVIDEPDSRGYLYRGQWSAISGGAGRVVTICEE